MLKRTITGAFITVIVYGVLYFSYIPEVIMTAAAVLCAFAVYEIYHAADMIKNEGFLMLSVLAGAGAMLLPFPHYVHILYVAFVLAAAFFVMLMVRQKQVSFFSPFKALFTVLLITVLFKAIPELRGIKNGFYYLLFAVTLCFITDVFAYLIGRRFGRHHILPSVSPNKTVEGSVAGIVFSLLFALLGGALLCYYKDVSFNYGLLALYAVLTSAVGQFGDFSMSAVKRICKVKDFGNLFPGHGGILDRFDSHLFAVAFTLLFCHATGGFLI